MEKKKLFLIIGGVVVVIAIVLGLVFGLGGNKTETPDVDVTTPTVGDEVDSTDGIVDDNDENTNEGVTSGEADNETTEPNITVPDIDINDFEAIQELLNTHLREDGTVKNSEEIQCDGYTAVVQLFPDNETVLNKMYPDGDYEQYTYDSNGNIVLHTMYNSDSELLYRKETRDETKHVLDNRESVGHYEEYDNNGKVIAKATFKIVDGQYYVLTKEIVGSYTITVSYHDSAPTVMSEIVYDGANYYHCKWNASGNSDSNLTYYEYRGADGSYSQQSGSINLFMLPSPPTDLTFDLTGLC